MLLAYIDRSLNNFLFGYVIFFVIFLAIGTGVGAYFITVAVSKRRMRHKRAEVTAKRRYHIDNIDISKINKFDCLPNDFVVVSLKTIGNDYINDDIVEVGAVKVVGGVAKKHFDQIICPYGKINPYSLVGTGIQYNELAINPYLDDVMPDFEGFIGEDVIVVCSEEELMFLIANTERYLNNKTIDISLMAKEFLSVKETMRLKDIAKRMEVEYKIEQSSVKNCYTIFNCYDKMRKLKLN